jgi:hypothetical protein
MKEATGELNMTVVTVVAVAALLAFFYLVIWPNLKVGMTLSSACSAANGAEYKTSGGEGSNAWKITCPPAAAGATQKCEYKQGSKTSTRTCNDNRN